MSVRHALVSILAVSAILSASLRAQDQTDRTLGEIYKYLNRDMKSRESRAFASPLLFVGEIVALGPVFQGVCKAAVKQEVDFAVSELLLGDLPSDTFHYGYPNCTRHPLPSPPFALLSRVILFCHHRHLCEQPLPATPEHLAKVRAWLDEAKRPEDNAAFAQLKLAIKKAQPLQTARDLVFEGEITRVQQVGPFVCTTAMGRETEISVVHILFGEAPKAPILASYGSVNCPIPLPLSVHQHAKVIVYCALQMPMAQACLTPVEDSPERVAQVAFWISGEKSAPTRKSEP